MECMICGSKINDGDSICNICGSPIKQMNQNNMPNINYNNMNSNMINSNMISQPMNTNSNNYSMKAICYDFICPHCGLKIPENQLYQFIHRPQPIPVNINQTGGFNNMPVNNNQINPNLYNNANSFMSSFPNTNNFNNGD